VLVLALDRTFVVAFVFEDVESADVALTFNATEVVPAVPEASAEVGAEMPAAPEEAFRSGLPELDAPDPAPDDEPAVFDAIAVGAVLIEDDWM
jgi:hypothetical protein